jgi:hypothetical protein
VLAATGSSSRASPQGKQAIRGESGRRNRSGRGRETN